VSFKTGSDEADVTSLVRLFHAFAPATGKAQPPNIDWQKNGMSMLTTLENDTGVTAY